jgi:hypothetical protein
MAVVVQSVHCLLLSDTGIVDLNATKGTGALFYVGPVVLTKDQKCIKKTLPCFYLWELGPGVTGCPLSHCSLERVDRTEVIACRMDIFILK